MPVRSLRSSVLVWPDARRVRAALDEWAGQLRTRHPEVVAVGCFGSYVRGDWGVGSDLDVVLVVAHSDQPRVRRAAHFDAGQLPVPVDLLVYTAAEWRELVAQSDRLTREVEWVAGLPPLPGAPPQ